MEFITGCGKGTGLPKSHMNQFLAKGCFGDINSQALLALYLWDKGDPEV